MTRFRILLVTADKIPEWGTRPDRLHDSLLGPGYLYVFADLAPAKEDPQDSRRQVADVRTVFTCHVSAKFVAVRKDHGTPSVTPWRHP